jgi:quinol monooxygenase YgiN
MGQECIETKHDANFNQETTMKAQILQTFAALALFTTSATAQDNAMENHTASYIAMPAAEGQTGAFAEFLAGAAPIVRKQRPGTVLWFALQADDMLAIFDIFADEEARDAHFSGAVAAALKQNADALVDGGWGRRCCREYQQLRCPVGKGAG